MTGDWVWWTGCPDCVGTQGRLFEIAPRGLCLLSETGTLFSGSEGVRDPISPAKDLGLEAPDKMEDLKVGSVMSPRAVVVILGPGTSSCRANR